MFNSRIYFGIVEDRDDRLALGRCKVRVVGMHTHDLQQLPTEDLPWAIVMQPPGGSQVVAPTEGTEVVVVFADEPDCQIPIVIGSVPTIPQNQSVWINQIPDEPRICDITDPVVGHSLPRNANEDSLIKSTEIRTDGPTTTDQTQASNVIEGAKDSVLGSIQVIGDSGNIPTAQGRSPKASEIMQQFGSANPSVREQLVNEQIQTGSAIKATESYAKKLQQLLGSDSALNILSGRTSLTSEIGKMLDAIGDANNSLGMKRVDTLLTQILHQTPIANLKQLETRIRDQLHQSVFDIFGISQSGILGSIAGIKQGINNIENAFDGDMDWASFRHGLQSIGFVGRQISNLGTGISSVITANQQLLGPLNALIGVDNQDKVGNSLGNLANNTNNVITNAINDPNKVLSSINNSVGGLIDKASSSFNDVTSSVSDIFNGGASIDSADQLTGPGGEKWSDTAAKNVGDQLTNQLRNLLASGLSPGFVVIETMEKIESYSSKIEEMIAAPAVAKYRENWDPDYITEPIRATMASWRMSMWKAMSYVARGGMKVIDFITKAFTKAAKVIFDVFGFAGSLVSSIIQMLGLDKLISGIISSLMPGGKSSAQVGVDPAAATNNIANGTYSSEAFKKVGNRENLDKVGSGKATSAMFAGVGEGTTPPVHGMWGGSNFGGGVLPDDKSNKTIDPSKNPSQATRTVNATLPDIPLTIYGCTDKNTATEYIKMIAGTIPASLPTVEAQATFLALSFAYCHCIPIIRDYEYTSKQQLVAKFPHTFSRASDSTINNFLFARSQNKKTAEQFYNYVYDSANDGQSLGNVNIGDGYKYAEAGLLPIVGRNAYVARQTNAAGVTSNVAIAIAAAMPEFINAIANAPAGSNAVFYQALSHYSSIDKTLAKQAFEHFYGAKLFESYQTTTKVAGTQYDRSSYYGSAQEAPVQYGFQDPNGKYPYVRNKMRSSINPLARGESINTIVTNKEAIRRVGIPIALSQDTWEQPHTGYATVYPYNSVHETESGHVIEYDDTPGAERMHWYHRTGTFVEVGQNGTKTSRIIGDNYEIIDRNGFISINGTANVTVGGNINIFCQSDANIEVSGSTEIQTHGSFNLAAANDVNISAGGSINMWANNGLNAQSNNNINVRSHNSDVYLTSAGTMSIVADGDAYLSTEQNLNVAAAKNVSIEAETGTMDLLSEDSMSVSSASNALQLYGGSNTFLTGGRNVNIYGGLSIHQECLLNFTILSSGWFRAQSSAIDIKSLSYMHLESLAEASLSALGAVTVNATGALHLGATGLINVNAGGALTMGAGAAASIRAGGIVGIDGTIIGLNSGMSVPCSPVVAIPTLPVGGAVKATLAQGAAQGLKAVMYGMATISPRNPLYPVIPALSIETPIVDREQVIETIDELNSGDGQLIQKSVMSNVGVGDMVAGPTVNPPLGEGFEHSDSPYMNAIINDRVYNANTKLSEHFNLGDFFDGGFNKRHVLQDQCGLSKADIVANLANLATNVLEKIGPLMPGGFEGYRKQWRINSGYRMTANNAAIHGSSKTSQHLTGQAVDLQLIGGSKSAHYDLIQKVASSCGFDQLILEYSVSGRSAWIHCSYDPKRDRQQCLTINLALNRTSPGFQLYA